MSINEEQIARNVERALKSLRDLSIPVTPVNYHVFFEHMAAINSPLSQVLKVYLDSKHHLTQETIQSLFETYVAPAFGDQSVVSAIDLDRVISQTMEIIEASRNAATELAADVSEVAHSIDPAPTSGARIAEAVGRLAIAARQAINRASEAERELASNLSETRNIREKFELAHRASLTDGLTNIANRKHFDQQIRQMAAQAMEVGEPLALAMIDIDHFKKFNDTHGHQLGDSVIKLVAKRLATDARPTDFPARYGGEEFALLMGATNSEAAVSVADRIRLSLAGKILKKRDTGEPIGGVTISSGVAVYKFGETIDNFIERADKALYKAKQAGRNCVVLAD